MSWNRFYTWSSSRGDGLGSPYVCIGVTVLVRLAQQSCISCTLQHWTYKWNTYMHTNIHTYIHTYIIEYSFLHAGRFRVAWRFAQLVAHVCVALWRPQAWIMLRTIGSYKAHNKSQALIRIWAKWCLGHVESGGPFVAIITKTENPTFRKSTSFHFYDVHCYCFELLKSGTKTAVAF